MHPSAAALRRSAESYGGSRHPGLESTMIVKEALAMLKALGNEKVRARNASVRHRKPRSASIEDWFKATTHQITHFRKRFGN